MKKLYSSILILACAATGSVFAQSTTITSVAVPQIGYTYNMSVDTMPSDLPSFTVSPGSGSAQTWNYTTQFANIYGSATAFVTPSSGSGSSNFPGATMASASGTDWVYWVTNSGGLFIDGVYTNIQGTPTAINFNPNATQLPVPLNYTTPAIVCNYAANFMVSAASVNHRAQRTITPDAFGSLTTPAGTYPNTLRVKMYEITSDSAFVFGSFQFGQWDTTTSYTWVQNSQDAQLMSIDFDKTMTVTKAQYLQSFSNGVATVSQPTASFNLFPNPASDMTYFTYENKTTGPVSIQLFDLNGRQVAELVNETQVIGKQKLPINVAALHLPKGLYFLQLNSNNSLQTIKLSVN